MKPPVVDWVNSDQALSVMRQGGVLLDVRMPQEYGERAIKGAINAPLYTLREAAVDFESVDKFRSPDWYDKLHVPLTTERIVPGRRYVIRKKGVVEAAASACAGCHSRVMPDGTLRNGPQTTFPVERDFAWTIVSVRESPLPSPASLAA